MALMVLKTLEAMGPLHGYGIARRIEQISGDRLSLNYGSIYPALLRLEQERAIASEWGMSENNRKAKYYRLTAAGRRQLKQETADWQEASTIVARFLAARSHVMRTLWALWARVTGLFGNNWREREWRGSLNRTCRCTLMTTSAPG